MAEKNSRALVSLVVVLLAGLILVFFLWQRDQESKDLEVDIGLDAEPAAPTQVHDTSAGRA